MSQEYRDNTSNGEIVRDFIAGMTDEYFLAQCREQFYPPDKGDFLLRLFLKNGKLYFSRYHNEGKRVW